MKTEGPFADRLSWSEYLNVRCSFLATIHSHVSIRTCRVCSVTVKDPFNDRLTLMALTLPLRQLECCASLLKESRKESPLRVFFISSYRRSYVRSRTIFWPISVQETNTSSNLPACRLSKPKHYRSYILGRFRRTEQVYSARPNDCS